MIASFSIRRAFLMLILLAIAACSGKKESESLKDLTGQKLVDTLTGERKTTAAHIRLMGLAYINFKDNFDGKLPGKLEDLKGLYESDRSKELEADLRERIDFVWDAKLAGQPGSENIILTYERTADKDGYRVVTTGVGELRMMDENAFQTALKAARVK